MVGGVECHWRWRGFCPYTGKVDSLVTGGLFWSTHPSPITLTCVQNQVVGDHQLLQTARDYFHFATTFLEIINTSATHIYHSALELSPLSSVVRKFYYHQRPCISPRVVIGTSDSRKASAAVSTSHSHYLSSTWSPCGQFVAVVAREAVEVWNTLTLKLLSTMQSPAIATRFNPGIAYSPDGLCLAGCSSDAIIIWDIQTGGVIGKIKIRMVEQIEDFCAKLNGLVFCYPVVFDQRKIN